MSKFMRFISHLLFWIAMGILLPIVGRSVFEFYAPLETLKKLIDYKVLVWDVTNFYTGIVFPVILLIAAGVAKYLSTENNALWVDFKQPVDIIMDKKV